MDLKSTYNKIARDWMVDHQGDSWWKTGIDKFISLLKQKDIVLDVGCGAGEKSIYLAKNGLKVIGMDFSEEMIKIAKERLPTCRFFEGDIRQTLKLDEYVEGVFAQAVLLHIPKKEIVSVLKNIIEPLKSGGYFYIAVKEQKEAQTEEEIVVENDYGYEYERFFSYYTKAEIQNYLVQLELEIVYENIAGTGKTNWIQLIAKK